MYFFCIYSAFEVKRSPKETQEEKAAGEVLDTLKSIDIDNYSFLLCKESDLVLGKYTSLMDECIFSKIPTLILDYNHQTKKIVSEPFDYGTPDLFCQSFEDLKNKIDLALKGTGPQINNEKFFSF